MQRCLFRPRVRAHSGHGHLQSGARSRRTQRRSITPHCQAVVKLFCFGSGLSATDLCSSLGNKCSAYVTSRSPDRGNGHAYDVIIFDGATHPVEDRQLIQSATHILVGVPPDVKSRSDQVLRTHQEDIIHSNCQWLGYLSSTGVYGDWQGAEVDETSSLRATTDKLNARIAAEQQWLDMYTQHSIPVHIFRLGGIYGPGRSLLDAVRRTQQGEVSSSQRRRGQQAATARIHVADVTQALLLSMASPTPGEVFNLVDDDCTGRAVAMEYAADLLDAPRLASEARVPSGPEQSSSMGESPADRNSDAGRRSTCEGAVGDARSQAGEHAAQQMASRRGEKRVSNVKAKRILGWVPAYPSYKEGLASIAAAEQMC